MIFRESLDTLILGALSSSLGIVIVLATLSRMGRFSVSVDLPQTTYLALVWIGTSLGVTGVIRARVMKRLTSPLSTLGAVLCCSPASPQILDSLGIYILIMAPFAIVFYGSALVGKLVRLAVSREESDTEDSENDEPTRF